MISVQRQPTGTRLPSRRRRCCASPGRMQGLRQLRQLAPGGVQRHLPLLGHDPQQGQPGGIHSVVYIHAQPADHPAGDPVDDQVDGDPVPVELGDNLLGVPEGGGVGGDHHNGPVGGAVRPDGIRGPMPAGQSMRQ